MRKIISRSKKIAILALTLIGFNAFSLENGDKFKDWEGKCESIEGQKICGVSQTIFDEDKKPIVNIFIRKVEGQTDPVAFIKVPLGVNLRAGLGLAVDKAQIAQVPYTFCDPAGCNAILQLDTEKSNAMKKGKELEVGVFLVDNQVVMAASLSGISKAFGAL